MKINTPNTWLYDLITGSSPVHLKITITGSKHQIILETPGKCLGERQIYEKQYVHANQAFVKLKMPNNFIPKYFKSQLPLKHTHYIIKIPRLYTLYTNIQSHMEHGKAM